MIRGSRCGGRSRAILSIKTRRGRLCLNVWSACLLPELMECLARILRRTRTDRATLDVTNLSSVMAACKEYRRAIITSLRRPILRSAKKSRRSLSYKRGRYLPYGACRRAVGAKLVYISTSGIFDGTKSEPYTTEDIPSPVNVYGHSNIWENWRYEVCWEIT